MVNGQEFPAGGDGFGCLDAITPVGRHVNGDGHTITVTLIDSMMNRSLASFGSVPLRNSPRLVTPSLSASAAASAALAGSRNATSHASLMPSAPRSPQRRQHFCDRRSAAAESQFFGSSPNFDPVMRWSERAYRRHRPATARSCRSRYLDRNVRHAASVLLVDSLRVVGAQQADGLAAVGEAAAKRPDQRHIVRHIVMFDES